MFSATLVLVTYKILRSRENVKPRQLLVITGCNSGLGYSWAIYGWKLGFTVVAGVLNEDGEGSNDLKNRGIHVLPLDITCNESIQKFKERIEFLLQKERLGMLRLYKQLV